MNKVVDYKVFKLYETAVSKIELRSDGIVRIQMKDDIEVDLEQSKRIFEIVSSFAEKKELFVLVIGGKNGTITKEARDFSGSDEASSITIAEAVVTPSLPQKIFINFILNFYKPKRELRLFNTEEAALKWLYTLKEKYKI